MDHRREARCGPAPRLPSAVHARSHPSRSTWDDESRVGGRENGPTARESTPHAQNDLLRAKRPLYATAAGGATFLGNAVVSVVLPWGGAGGVVWTFVALYVAAFVVLSFLKVPSEAEAAGH